MSNEHQPGSPGVDLDALERRLELDLGSWGNSKTKYAAVFAELRTLRARVGELESKLRGAVHAVQDAVEANERLTARAESAEARVRELECAEAELNLENGRLRDRLDTILTITRRGKRILHARCVPEPADDDDHYEPADYFDGMRRAVEIAEAIKQRLDWSTPIEWVARIEELKEAVEEELSQTAKENEDG